MTSTAPAPVMAIACGTPMPLDPAVLCHRIACNGEHSSDGRIAWLDGDEPDPDRRTP